MGHVISRGGQRAALLFQIRRADGDRATDPRALHVEAVVLIYHDVALGHGKPG